MTAHPPAPAPAEQARTFNEPLFIQRMANLGHRTAASRAEAAEVHRKTVYRWGQGQTPTLAHAAKIAALLDVTVDDLFPPTGTARVPKQRGRRSTQ